MQIASSCLANVTPFYFWSLVDHFPDLVSRLHVQVRLIDQFSLNGRIPWHCDSDGAFCFAVSAKANNKDNYRGITLFPTLCKIYETILFNRLDNFAAHKGFFSEMQFGFQEGVGCTEASFTILETINHMLERGSKVFSCFLDVRKAFDTVWIDGILYKVFSELGVGGRMWKVIKDLYTNVKAHASLVHRIFGKIDGTGQGRILAPFMYKVYVNGLLCVLTNHCHAIFINGLRIPSPSFADDITLLALHPSFFKTFMSICYKYGIKWRYEFNHSKSGIW